MKSTKKILKFILIILLSQFVLHTKIIAETKTAKISLNINDTIPSNNTPMLFGQFIEFLNNIINSPTGVWAQDLYHRGFDASEYINDIPTGTSHNWRVFSSDNLKNSLVYQYPGGYNKNGREYQIIHNKADSVISGVYQTIYVDDEIGSDFYVYLKGYEFNNNSKIIFSLVDSVTNIEIDKKIIYPSEISLDWKKFTCSFNPNNFPSSSHRAKLNILLQGTGYLNIDEASLMQSDNINGMKKDMFEMFKKLKPGILRYPGGEFADTRMFRWLNTTEHIDQRLSPNYEQRVDFGLHQFMKFCRDISTLPYLVVNQENDNLQSNVNYIDYCNSDTNTIMGKLRAKNGDLEPFKVKYWCVGNEQWMPNYIDYAYDYNSRVKMMKKIDPNFKSVLWGNYWDYYRYFDSVMKVVGFNTQSYSYHITALCLKVEDVNDTILEYDYTVGGAEIAKNSTTQVLNWLKKDGYFPKIKHCIPEWWPNYEAKYEWLDSAKEANRIESAIVSSQFLNHYFKSSESLDLAIRTTGLAFLRCGFDSKGKRVIYGTPDLHSFIMYRNHFGNKTLNTNVECEKYNLPMKIGYADVFDNNRVEAVATKSNDTLYLHIVNKYSNQDLEIELDFDLDSLGEDIKLYTVASNYITAENSPDNPNLISEKELEIKLQRFIKLPKLSVSILAIPLKKELNSIDTINTNLVNINNYVVNDILQINTFIEDLKIEIFDFNGKLIYDNSLIINTNSIDVSSFSHGLYYIKRNFTTKFKIY